MNGHLAQAAEDGQGIATELPQTLAGFPSVAALSTGGFVTATENPNGDLFVNGVDEHEAVEQGDNPAIAGDGGGGETVFESLDNFMYSLTSAGKTDTFEQARVSSGASPAITGLFSG